MAQSERNAVIKFNELFMKHFISASLFLFIILSVFINNGLKAQTSNVRYKREMKKFMKFIRKSEFERYPVLEINNYLCNKGLFNGIILFGTGVYGLSNEEKSALQKAIYTDTTKYYINKHLMKNIQFVSENENYYYRLSKPIFLRNFSLCVFSFMSVVKPDESQEWTYMYKKEKGKWSKLLVMGKILSY